MRHAIQTLNPEITSCLRAVRSKRRTGRLLAERDDSSRELHFRDGRIVGVRTTVEEERLGRILVRSGRMTEQHYEDACVFVRHGWRLGAILVELKILEPSEIDPVLKLQAIEVGCAILAASDQHVTFEETDEVFMTLGAALSIPDVIMEAARRIETASNAGGSLHQDDRLFREADSTTFEDCSNLTPEEAFLLSRFHGGATIATVVETCGLSEAVALRGILGLVECGTLVPVGSLNRAPAQTDPMRAFCKEVDRIHRRLERMDPWRALDLPSDVGTATAHAAFRDAVRRYHPDRYHNLEDPDFQAKLKSVCASFTTAYTCLTTALQMRRSDSQESAIPLGSTAAPEPPAARKTNPSPTTKVPRAETPAEPTRVGRFEVDDRRPPVRDPEVYYREAKHATLQGDFWRAIELVRMAIDLWDDKADYHFLLGEALSKNPLWRHDAERSYRRAMELAPHCAKYREGLARLYQSVGLNHRAQNLLERVGDLSSAAAWPESGKFQSFSFVGSEA